MTMTRANWSETKVHLGTLREIKMIKTAPRGIKDDNDTRQLELKVSWRQDQGLFGYRVMWN